MGDCASRIKVTVYLQYHTILSDVGTSIGSGSGSPTMFTYNVMYGVCLVIDGTQSNLSIAVSATYPILNNIPLVWNRLLEIELTIHVIRYVPLNSVEVY